MVWKGLVKKLELELAEDCEEIGIGTSRGCLELRQGVMEEITGG